MFRLTWLGFGSRWKLRRARGLVSRTGLDFAAVANEPVLADRQGEAPADYDG